MAPNYAEGIQGSTDEVFRTGTYRRKYTLLAPNDGSGLQNTT